MDQDERIEEAAENRYKTVPEKTKWICKDSFKDGWKACVDQEEWKNLYSEGVTVGMNLRKQSTNEEYHQTFLEIWKEKADKWDKLQQQVAEYWPKTDEDVDDSHLYQQIGEDTAIAMGYV